MWRITQFISLISVDGTTLSRITVYFLMIGLSVPFLYLFYLQMNDLPKHIIVFLFTGWWRCAPPCIRRSLTDILSIYKRIISLVTIKNSGQDIIEGSFSLRFVSWAEVIRRGWSVYFSVVSFCAHPPHTSIKFNIRRPSSWFIFTKLHCEWEKSNKEVSGCHAIMVGNFAYRCCGDHQRRSMFLYGNRAP